MRSECVAAGSASRFSPTLVFVLSMLCALMLLSAIARADFVPTHGAVTHLDPWIPGWPNPAPPPIAGAGMVVPHPWYDVVGPGAADAKAGFDGLFSPPNPWHWEIEIDVDPYSPNTGAVHGVLPVAFIMNNGAGPIFGPFLMAYGDGPDIYFDIHQNDMVFGDVGGFFKALINLWDIPVAWGTSVTEDPSEQPPLGKSIQFAYSPQFNFTYAKNGSDNDSWTMTGNAQSGYAISQTPEPTIGAGVLGVLVLFGRHRTRERC